MMELPPNLPVGVRFHPTDEELLTRYLRPKILGQRFDDAIAELDFCDHEPWELPSRSYIRSEDRQWWFICRQKFINAKSQRVNRTTKTGFWKITGQERAIRDQKSTCIGKKRTLVFHSNPAPGKRTNWVMQEYYVNTDIDCPRERASYVICRLKVKMDEKVNTPRGEPNTNISPDLEILGPSSELQWFHGQAAVNDQFLDLTNCGLTEDDMQMMLSDDYNPDGIYILQSGRDKSEESPEDFADGPYLTERTGGNFFSESTPPSSLKRSYFRDGPDESDTDADAANGQHARISWSSSLPNSPESSKKVRQMRMVNKSSESLRTFATSGDFVQHKVKPNQFPEEKPSSKREVVALAMELSSHVSVKGGDRQKRVQIRNNSLSPAMSSYKGKISPGLVATSSNLQQRSVESSSSKWKSFFVFDEPSSVSRRDLSLPLSVYWFNVVIGSLLFVIFVRELVVFGSW